MPKLPPLKEQALKTLIKNYLLAKGHFVWVNNSGFVKRFYTNKQGVENSHVLRMGTKGGADLIGIEKGTGRFIAVECKVGYNKPTPDQQEFLHEIERRGGHAIVAYTLDDVQRYL